MLFRSDALQGSLIVEGGRGLALPSELARPRAAVGVTADGRLLVAEGIAEATALQSALIAAGAWRAMALVTPDGAAIHWGDGLLDAYPASTLFVLGRPLPSPLTRLEPFLAGAR